MSIEIMNIGIDFFLFKLVFRYFCICFDPLFHTSSSPLSRWIDVIKACSPATVLKTIIEC